MRNIDLTVFIPKELHSSIRHDSWSGSGLRDMNIAALKWCAENLEISEIDRMTAIRLSLRYNLIPEPDFIMYDVEEIIKSFSLLPACNYVLSEWLVSNQT
jgi:hypothetical protein